MKRVLAVLVLTLIAAPASADTYRRCLTMVTNDPDQAYKAAVEWRDYGGGAAAEHCMALAMASRGEFTRAAELLEELARRNEDGQIKLDSEAEPPSDRERAARQADLMAQAGNAWLVAGEVERAFTVFGDALSATDLPGEVRGEILIDRSRALAELERYEAALNDLDQAVGLLGARTDILTYRAAALRAQGALVRARSDVNWALELDPQNHEALFERASLNLLVGNYDGAIVDWTMVKKLAPDTPAAEAAQINIGYAEEARTAEESGSLLDDQPRPSKKAAPKEEATSLPDIPKSAPDAPESPTAITTAPEPVADKPVEPAVISESDYGFSMFPTEAIGTGEKPKRTTKSTQPEQQDQTPPADADAVTPEADPKAPVF